MLNNIIQEPVVYIYVFFLCFLLSVSRTCLCYERLNEIKYLRFPCNVPPSECSVLIDYCLIGAPHSISAIKRMSVICSVGILQISIWSAFCPNHHTIPSRMYGSSHMWYRVHFQHQPNLHHYRCNTCFHLSRHTIIRLSSFRAKRPIHYDHLIGQHLNFYH